MEGIKGSKIDGEERVPRSFSLATLVLVVVAVGLVGSSLWLATRRPIAGVSAPVVAARTPWQPEPSYLLEHQKELGLTAGQKRHMQVVMRDWEMRKGAYDVQLRRFHKGANDAIADLSLKNRPGGDYGKILASLEKDRDAVWRRAIAPLSPGQILKLETLRVPPPTQH